MIEVVYRRCPKKSIFTDAGVTEYIARKYGGTEPDMFMLALIPRDDAVLVAMVKENNHKLIQQCADVRIDDLPDGSAWQVKGAGDYTEWVAVSG